ncbi:ENPP3 phosphodiesterase, partial [Atractosteus spatula]|nr:ENPP3 phosphodiesterase [Atractosteus spatula]
MESHSKGVETKQYGHTEEPAAATSLMLEPVGASDQEEHTKSASRRKRTKKWKILAGVLVLCLLIILLAIILGLKLHEKAQVWTCAKHRCGEEHVSRSYCSCSDDCLSKGDCCANYNNICKGEKSWVEDKCEDLETPTCPKGFSKPPVILFSMDGFRAEYLHKWGHLLPTIGKLKTCGTTTPYMRPVYPTKTFPNHYTIVTGLYPESHGIVDNHMYDVTRDAIFSLKLPEKFNPQWYQGQPIWLTAMYNNLKAGTYFWPGSDVAVNGTFPNFYKNYSKGVSFEERVATVFRWLGLPEEERPQFYTLYVDEPDSSGHRYGPESSSVKQALLNVDKVMGLLMDGLKQRNLHKCTNLVIVSDHGMEEASCSRAEYVSNYLDNVNDFTVIQGPAARVRPKNLPDTFFTFDYEGLVKNLSCRVPDQRLKPYLTHHLPKRFHFANNVRIEKVHFYMKSQWQAALEPGGLKYCTGGFHGSDNMFKNMQGIFIGYGPGIKSNTTVAPFENIEVYNLLCDLLNISPAPNNGTHGSLNHILRRPFYTPTYPDEQSHPLTCSKTRPTLLNDLGCSCSSLTESEADGLNQQLLHTTALKAADLHLPYGTPHLLQKNATYCILHQLDYVNGYSKDLFMPLWIAYTIQASQSISPLNPKTGECLRADIRIPDSQSQKCSSYGTDQNFTFGFLHPPNFGTQDREPDSLLTSNIAPMYNAFKDVWVYIHDVLLVKYSQQKSGLNIISGPVFDYDYDGHFDTKKTIKQYVTGMEIPIPTHYYLILTSCKNSSFSPSDCHGQLDVTSFILPHRPDNSESCPSGSSLLWVEEWMKFHVARVRDIELLTGLSFYHNQGPVEKTLQLKTFLQTFQSQD